MIGKDVWRKDDNVNGTADYDIRFTISVKKLPFEHMDELQAIVMNFNAQIRKLQERCDKHDFS